MRERAGRESKEARRKGERTRERGGGRSHLRPESSTHCFQPAASVGASFLSLFFFGVAPAASLSPPSPPEAAPLSAPPPAPLSSPVSPPFPSPVFLRFAPSPSAPLLSPAASASPLPSASASTLLRFRSAPFFFPAGLDALAALTAAAYAAAVSLSESAKRAGKVFSAPHGHAARRYVCMYVCMYDHIYIQSYYCIIDKRSVAQETETHISLLHRGYLHTAW